MSVNDNKSVTSRTELLTSLENEQTKQHIVFDISTRPILVFEAPIGAKDGSPCLVTEYVYLSANSTAVRTRQERVSKWSVVWEADFIFDPNVTYDPDGDGAL